MRRSLMALAAVVSLGPALAIAQDRDYVPARRLVLTENTDLAGTDISTIFDTTIEGCEQACLSDGSCIAFTFNSRANSCFPKSSVTGTSPYSGAYSGFVKNAVAGSSARAATRAADLNFLQSFDFDAALEQARRLANDHITGDLSAAELLAEATASAESGDNLAASKFQGAALSLTDAADQWVTYGQLLADISEPDSSVRQAYLTRAFSAAVNGYLRADSDALRATALDLMARSLEGIGRGADMIPALRLAQSIQPRDDAAALLDDAIAKYGFRIEENAVESDNADPRICATFNQDLVKSGVDYATFVKLPQTGLSVEASGRQICISGVQHGQRYAVTFREGLPSAQGEQLARDVALNMYVRDRSPAVSFPGRAYILPRTGQSGIPVQTVNATTLDLTLLQVSDRNLIRAMQNDYFARPLDYWGAESLSNDIAATVWTGKADVSGDVNRDVTTLLPMDEALAGQKPGIYVLEAAVPGRDPYDNPPAMQWFVISDLGLTTMTGVDGLHVFVRSLKDASAVAGVTATLVSRSNAIIGTARADVNGYAHFGPQATSGTGSNAPGLISVELGDDYSFLSLTEAEFDLSDRGVAGREAAPPIDMFLTTERGAYRAGEVVNATILTRDGQADALSGLPVTVRLTRPDGVEYSRLQAAEAGAGGYAVSLPLSGGAPRGTWRIDAFVEEQTVLASESFLVEDFLPERIDFDLTLPDGPISLGDTPELTIAARYLFGAPGAGLAIEGDVRIAAATSVEGFDGYAFGRYDEPFSPYADVMPDAGSTDDGGNATVPVTLPDLGAQADRPVTAQIAVRLKEGSGRPVERRLSRTIMPETPVIGIRPAFADGVAAEGSDATFTLIAIGPDGKPAALPVRWTVNRLETDYQWYSLSGQWNWEVTTTRTRIASGETTLTAQGPQSVSARVDWGNYEIVVEAADGSPGASAQEFYAGWYVPADATQTPDTLELSLDKPNYRPGDTATVRIVPRAAGVALVTVVSNRLIDTRAVAVTQGENTLTLPVTDAWGAGAYVTASVIRPMDTAAGHNPARAIGLSYAAVDPGAHRLAAAFEAPAEASPRTALPVALKVDGIAPGETAFATIAAVDVGILNLTAFSAPDPEEHYFGQRKLGIGIRDIYGRLIDGQNGVAGKVRSGGDAANTLSMKAPPPTEELVAYFSGPVQVGPDGYARAEFALPSFNGTVRLMAVVWSRTAVGQAQSDILVRDPVVVTASVPRFMAPGDTSRLLLEVVHASGPAGRMGLDVTSDDLTLGATPSGLDLVEKGKQLVSIPLTAGASDGDGTIRIALTTPDGRQLLKVVTVPVRSNDPVVARTNRFTLAAGSTFTLDRNVFSGLAPGSARATLAVGPIARFDAPGLLAGLDRYPYGCTEQLVSKALPLLYFGDLARALDVRPDTDIARRIDQSIAAILLNQSSNGAFGLWNPDQGDFWLDAYVTDFLSRARAKGYAVPDAAFRNALDNLRNQVNYAPDFDAGGGEIAYALMVLAREGAAAIGDLRYFADVKGDAFDTPIGAAQLGAALAAYGDQTRADAMFTRAAALVARQAAEAEAQVIRADYGTNLRDATALLALAAEAGSQAIDANRLGEAVASRMAGRNLSTQESMWALLATNALIDRPGSDGLTVDGAAIAGPLVRVLDGRTEGAAQVITNGSGRETTLTLTTYGVPSEPVAAGGNGYTITRTWYTLDGAAVDPGLVKLGTRLVTVIEVTPYAGGEARLMVDDALPAGFEIDNPNLIRAGDIGALDWLDTVEETRTTEFRQDRFLAAVDWSGPDPFRLAYIVRAVSPGTFRLPAASVEDMFRPDYRARSDSGTVTITE